MTVVVVVVAVVASSSGMVSSLLTNDRKETARDGRAGNETENDDS